MKKLITILLIFNFQLLISNCQAQSPVDSVASGCALDFNGINNYITLTPMSNINGASQLTLQSWVNYSVGINSGTIFSQWSDGSIPLGNPDGFYALIGANGEVWANFNAGYGVFSVN